MFSVLSVWPIIWRLILQEADWYRHDKKICGLRRLLYRRSPRQTEKIKILEHQRNLRGGVGRGQSGQIPLQYFFLSNNKFCLLLSLRMEIKMFSK